MAAGRLRELLPARHRETRRGAGAPFRPACVACGATAPPGSASAEGAAARGAQPAAGAGPPRLLRKLENFCRTSSEPHSGHTRSSSFRKPWRNTSKAWPHASQTRS